MTAEDWDAEAAAFDAAPDHGLSDPATRTAWAELLATALPRAPSAVADLGCGTGTLTSLLSERGYRVHGVDLSPEMLERARHKVPGASFSLGDVSDPPLAREAFDVVLARHVLWALPDPTEAFGRWLRLLRPGGVVVLVEGRWSTGAGLTAEEATAVVHQHRTRAHVTHLTDPVYWGRTITDERYMIVSTA